MSGSLNLGRNGVEQSTNHFENLDSKSAAQVAGSEIDAVKMVDLSRNSELINALKGQLSSLLPSTSLSNYPFKQLQTPFHACLKPSRDVSSLHGRCGARDDAGEKILV